MTNERIRQKKKIVDVMESIAKRNWQQVAIDR